MTDIPVEWQKRIQDKAYLSKLWKPQFLEVEGLIFLEAHYVPDNLQQWLQTPGTHDKKKLENTINHIHLDDIATELELQHKIGEILQRNWKQALSQTFPHKAFEINLTQTNRGWELQLWTKTVPQ